MGNGITRAVEDHLARPQRGKIKTLEYPRRPPLYCAGDLSIQLMPNRAAYARTYDMKVQILRVRVESFAAKTVLSRSAYSVVRRLVMRVYHILSTEHALSDIALKRVKIATFDDLNDPFELLSLSLGIDQVRQAFLEWKRELSKGNGLLCFSKSWGSPVLWSHYGAKHTGMALGFDIDDEIVEPVRYTDQRTDLPIAGESIEFSEAFMKELLRTKFEHWKYEDEVRVFVQLDQQTAERGHYFFTFGPRIALREVILGPRSARSHPMQSARWSAACTATWK